MPELKARLQSIRNFYDNLKGKIHKVEQDMHGIGEKLAEEIKLIGNVKGQATTTKDIVDIDYDEDLRNFVIDAVQQLIDQCQNYRKRHSDLSDSM